MEHPGRIWNTIETRINKYLGRILPPLLLRWLWVLVHGGLIFCAGPVILTLFVFSAAFCDHALDQLFNETAELVAADSINPANNGKLVKVSGIVSISHPACDPLTGVQAQVLRLERIAGSATPGAKADDAPLPDAEFYPSAIQLGAFTIRHPGQRLKWSGDVQLHAPLEFGQAAEGYTLTPAHDGMGGYMLSTAGERPVARLRYRAYNAEKLYVIGRQIDNELDVSTPGTYIYTQSPHQWDWKKSTRFWMLLPGLTAWLMIFPIGGFVALCFVLGSLRSGLWHASGGRNLIRLHLGEAALILEIGGTLLLTGLIQLPGHEPPHNSVPGTICLIAAFGVLVYLLRRWFELRPARQQPPGA